MVFNHESFAGGPLVNNQPANIRDKERQVSSQGQEDPLEEEMTTHPSILAWKILYSS